MVEKVKELEKLVIQKQNEISSLNREYILFKEQTYKEIREVSSFLEEYEMKIKENQKLKKELQEIKNINIKLENEIKQLKDKVYKINKKLNAYMNSKLGRLTRQYWTFRKKLSSGGR